MTAEEARDAALKRITENAGEDWKISCLQVLLGIKRGTLLTGEIFRKKCSGLGLIPHHPNAWGGLIMGMIKQGLMEDVGDYRKTQDPKSHARKSIIYKVR